MSELEKFLLVFLGVIVCIGFALVIDKYRELVRLRKAYDAKVRQYEVTHEALSSLLQELSQEELKVRLEKYAQIVSDLSESPVENAELIEVYGLLFKEIQLQLSSLEGKGSHFDTRYYL